MTQIFIEPELDNLHEVENSTEWQSICEELGLQGQKQLSEKSPVNMAPPYMFLDPKTQRIIKTICPVGVLANNYSVSTIPLDILQEIKKCKDHGWYDEIKIFYDNISPDPFVIGILKSKTNTWQKDYHLIARWGAELLPFEELEIKAVNRLRTGIKQRMFEMKSKIDFALTNLDDFITNMISGAESPAANISIQGLDSWSDTTF